MVQHGSGAGATPGQSSTQSPAQDEPQWGTNGKQPENSQQPPADTQQKPGEQKQPPLS
jgi:hypothetical protein